MFIPRIWFDESERIGKQRCTPVGYVLHGIGDLIGFIGLLMLLATPLYLSFMVVSGSFRWSLLWLFVVPIALGIVGSVIVSLSWGLAHRKQFRFDYERRESSWIENGERRTYSYANGRTE